MATLPELEEGLCRVQAQAAVQQRVLLALVRSHPDPNTLLLRWHELVRDAEKQAFALPSDLRASDLLSEQCRTLQEDWTAELVDLALPPVL